MNTKKRKPKAHLREFTFIGDTVHENPNNPPSTEAFGYHFELDGPSVKVRLEVADELAKRAHFRED